MKVDKCLSFLWTALWIITGLLCGLLIWPGRVNTQDTGQTKVTYTHIQEKDVRKVGGRLEEKIGRQCGRRFRRIWAKQPQGEFEEERDDFIRSGEPQRLEILERDGERERERGRERGRKGEGVPVSLRCTRL